MIPEIQSLYLPAKVGVESQETPMHKAKALVINCIDFRFQKLMGEELEKRNLVNQFDRISLPGAAKDTETVVKAAEVSLKLHDPDEAIIIEHTDCGAYGEDNSIGAHRQNAEKLAQALRKIKPDLTVHTLIATPDGIEQLG